MLAHAVKALAEAHLGMGDVLRQMVAGSLETNRILGLIHDQNAHIAERLDAMGARHSESEKAIRVVQSTQHTHAQHIARLEAQAGIPTAQQLGRSATLAR